jgi:SecD/SecF fusion protein
MFNIDHATYMLLVGLAVLTAILLIANRFFRPFYWRIAVCTFPIVLAAVVVENAFYKYRHGEGGFKLGVDLVGGTILVYELDLDKFTDGKLPPEYQKEQLVASLKRRIDPADLYNVTIRPVSDTRVEIILPTGGRHRAAAAAREWNELVAKVREKWPPKEGEEYKARLGQVAELGEEVRKHHPDVPAEEINEFIKEHDKRRSERKDLTGEEVQGIKDLISRVGSLEFRILANSRDDGEAFDAAIKFFNEAKENEKRRRELEDLALSGKPPPFPNVTDGYPVTLGGTTYHVQYSWVELGRSGRAMEGLSNTFEQTKDPRWLAAKEARDKGEAYISSDGLLIYSRPFVNLRASARDANKKYEYFVLTRDPEPGKAITGQYLTNAYETQDNRGAPAVGFRFNAAGAALFGELTERNRPDGRGEGGFKRRLAVILDGQIESAPSLEERIGGEGIIRGEFTSAEINRYIRILRAGQLPASLKPQPVSENTMGSTLGEDTIQKGMSSIVIAFLAVLAFMIWYYRFAGLVACIALFANLLLTVAFMVAVQATFTLPGLAGIVLTLALAVDANVLIYERLREERDRGATLALAIRNGYDKAFPTIIDTHLSSIFTAIVLYAVGNDQLKGFGISLTVGLVISLFTALYMTRLIFELCLDRGILHKLSMVRFLTTVNIDFMAIRNAFFAATVFLTIVGFGIFFARIPDGLNIDFNGGTLFSAQLNAPQRIETIRERLDAKAQANLLAVQDVKPLDERGFTFEITYAADGAKRTIELPNAATVEEVRRRASLLPDPSVELIFTGYATGTASDRFTIRTSEKSPELVQAAISRLLGKDLKKIDMKFEINQPGQDATLTFTDPAADGKPVPASPGQVSMLLDREFKHHGINKSFNLKLEGTIEEGRSDRMRVHVQEPIPEEKFQAILEATRIEFEERPQPDRLETFDSQLAAETQLRAFWAIVASWLAILAYLWFRFGNWTFGTAAVLCLIHDLLFTLGIIALCHYIHLYLPAVASVLLIQDFKIDLPAIAALLTLVGYSVNDTIVVFDRIREVRGKSPELTFAMINTSINQTLSRTILTSTITFLTVFVLYAFGGDGIHLFAFCMVVGVLIGTYSSIYVAAPLLILLGEGAGEGQRRETRKETAEANV